MAFETIPYRLQAGTLSVDDLPPEIWGAFEQGAADRTSPWWTTFLFSAAGTAGNARAVTLRAADPETRTLTFFTDVRSPKFNELGGRVGTVTYDPKTRIQLRVYGRAVHHHNDDRARSLWDAMTVWSRRAYLRQPAPGSPLYQPGTGLPPLDDGKPPTEADLEPGFGNFAVIDLTIDRLDWLLLTDDGNRAARFDWADEHWNGDWRVP